MQLSLLEACGLQMMGVLVNSFQQEIHDTLQAFFALDVPWSFAQDKDRSRLGPLVCSFPSTTVAALPPRTALGSCRQRHLGRAAPSWHHPCSNGGSQDLLDLPECRHFSRRANKCNTAHVAVLQAKAFDHMDFEAAQVAPMEAKLWPPHATATMAPVLAIHQVQTGELALALVLR